MTDGRRLWLGVLAVFLVALALRLGHLAALHEGLADTRLFHSVRGDAVHHWNEAREILDGDFWLRDRIPWKGPGYSYFLAALMSVFGRSPGTLRWPLAVLGALNCAGLVLLARRALPLRWSVAAGLIAATNGVLILFDGELLFPTLLISLNLPVLLLLSREEAGAWAHAAGGLLLGVSALVHPVYLLPAAALAAWAVARHRRRGLALGLGVVLAVAPSFGINLLLRGQPVLISWNGGINLYVGNHPNFDPYSGNRTAAWKRILETPIDAGIEEEHRRDRLYYRLALGQIARHPLTATAVFAKKAVALVSPVEYANNIRLYELRRRSPVLAWTLGRWGPLWLPFGLWAPAAVVGFVIASGAGRRVRTVTGLWTLGLAASILLSFATARYRAPIVFFGSMWAAHALALTWEAAHAGAKRRLAGLVAAYVVLVAIVGACAVPQRGYPLPLAWDEAALRTAAGEFESAERWAERALAEAPHDAPLRLAVAGLYASWNRPDRERACLREMLAMPDLEPELRSTGHELLAVTYTKQNRHDDARREIGAALDVGVDRTEWHGHPHYQLGLGPLNACRLRLRAAEIEARAGDLSTARRLMARVGSECGDAGRLGKMLEDLEILCIVAGGDARTDAEYR